MTADDEYPGCPHCDDVGFNQCSCEKISCGGGMQDCGDHGEMTCPWCGNEGEYSSADDFDVSGGGY
jgi:hypothetical protein